MSIEKLGDFLSTSYNKGFLTKIFLGQRFEQEIRKSFKEEVKVIMKDSDIFIVCKNPSQAKFFNLKKRALYSISTKLLKTEAKKYQLKVKVG